MTTRGTFRFGELKASDSGIPTPEELGEGIENDFTIRSEEEDPVTGETVEFAEKGRNVYVSDEYEDYNFCFFTYVTDTPDSFRVRDEDGEEKESSEVVLEVAWAIYFENGQFAFQSREDIAEAWIPRFIKKRTGYEVTNDDFRLDSLGQPELKQWYGNADRISKIKFGRSGDSGVDLSGAGRELRELAEIANGMTISTGQGNDSDLRNSSLVDTAVESLEINQMNVKNGDENMITLKQSGRINISWNESEWDEDNLPRNRGQTVRQKLRPYMIAVAQAN
jgi:hypothetical protein